MRELELVERIRKVAESGAAANSSIIHSIGDDCAVIRPRPREDLVFTTDFVLQGRHFLLEKQSADDIGHIALARSLSDLAAMGSEPLFCLISIAVPAELADKWLRGFYKGLLFLAMKHKITIAGGDLSRFDNVVADVMCCGRVPRGKAMLRSAAKPGDSVYVTGPLGAPKRPEPRVAEGIALRQAGVKACIDISDGLVIDLHRLCRASWVRADLEEVPIAKGASLDDALHRGEDYELLFTTRKPNVDGIRIGTIVKGKPGEVRYRGKPLPVKGFDHFDASSR